MKKHLFCVMNPFDKICIHKEIDCLAFAFLDNSRFNGQTVNSKSGFMKIQTDQTLPGLNPLASNLACVFFMDENTFYLIDQIDVDAKAYNFVKLIEGIGDFSQYLFYKDLIRL